MPDLQGRHLGDDEFVYVKLGSLPVSPLDPSSYTKVGLVKSNPFSGQRATVDAVDKDSADFVSKLAGDGSYTIGVETNRKLVSDAGQLILRDAFVSGATVSFLISSNVEDEEAVYGTGIVEKCDRPSARGEVSTYSFSIAGQGAPTFATITV